MNIITKRTGEISFTKFNEIPSSARVTLTDELIDMGCDLEKDKLTVCLVEDKDGKKIIIEKI